MAKYVLEVTSRTGEKVNQVTSSPSDSIAVYSDADLNQRLETAKADPRNLQVTVRPGGTA